MARVIVKESICLGKKFFDDVMVFDDVEDMVNKVGAIDGRITVFKGTFSNNFTQNIHDVRFHKNGVSYEIHLTENQFGKMRNTFKEMGEVRIIEHFMYD